MFTYSSPVWQYDPFYQVFTDCCYICIVDAMSLSSRTQISQCWSRWSLEKGQPDGLSHVEVIQQLRSLEPALQDAVQNKRTTRYTHLPSQFAYQAVDLLRLRSHTWSTVKYNGCPLLVAFGPRMPSGLRVHWHGQRSSSLLAAARMNCWNLSPSLPS